MNPLTPQGDRYPGWVRIRRRAEYQQVLKNGRKCVGRFVFVYSLPREHSGEMLPTRMGMTVSRRVGKATTRNRVKRRLREIYRRLHALLSPGNDFVVNCRPSAARATYQQLERDLSECLRKLSLLDVPQPRSSSSRDSSGGD